jgi:hypothetical protein
MARVMFDTGGRPFLSVTVKGKRARIYWEQRWARYGLLYLGAEFEEEVPVLYLPADEAEGRPEPAPLRGFTDDPALLRLYRRMIELDRLGELKPGPLEGA